MSLRVLRDRLRQDILEFLRDKTKLASVVEIHLRKFAAPPIVTNASQRHDFFQRTHDGRDVGFVAGIGYLRIAAGGVHHAVHVQGKRGIGLVNPNI